MFSVPRPRTRRTSAETVRRAEPTVLVTSRPPRHRIDYVDQLLGDDSAGEAPSGLVRTFDTNPSRTRDVDVVHLTNIDKAIGRPHTSEQSRIRRAKQFVKHLRRHRIALVLTVSGEEVGRTRSCAEAIIDAAAAARISMSTVASAPGHEVTVIAHSHLRDRYLGFPRGEAVPGRILITAHTLFPAEYVAAVKVFGVADLPGWNMRIAGGVSDDDLGSYLRTLGDHPDSISLRNEELSDAARVVEVTEAEIVLIAAPDTYEAQSIMLHALSLDRPVLVEDTPGTQALADEVGASWVRRYSGPLTARSLEAVLHDLRTAPPTEAPHLDAREPNAISAQYAAVMHAAAGQ